jgi:excisionase family DNA binding protein
MITPPDFNAAERLAFSIKEAAAAVGLSRRTLYQLIGAGLLDARKAGSRTIIVAASLRSYVASLPEARIKRPRARREAGAAR